MVVAAIDDRRDPIEGVWNLSGPEELTADEVFEIVGEGGVPAHLDPFGAAERLTELLEIPVSVRATEFFAGYSVADTPGATPDAAAAPDAANAFGVATDSLRGRTPAVAARVVEGRLIGCAAMPELVRLDVDDGVGIVRLDRPPANAISLQLSIELLVALEEAGSRDDVGALVLWGGPKLFAAGADIKEMVDDGPDEIREQVTKLGDACDLLEAMPKMSIAAITGFALGRRVRALARL